MAFNNGVHHWLRHKPPLGYDLDASHPLMRISSGFNTPQQGLQGAWLLNDAGIAQSAWDSSLYRNRLATPSNMGSGIDQPGRVLIPSTTSGYIQGACQAVPYPFTVVALVTLTAVNAASIFWTHDNGTTSSAFYMGMSSGALLQGNANGSVLNFAGLTFVANQWYLCAISVPASASTTATGYLMKWPAGVIQSATGTWPTQTPATLNTVTLAGRSTAAASSLRGSMALCYWWKGALTAGQITDLFGDIYQIFLPPNHRRWFVQSGIASQPWTWVPTLGPILAQ